MAVRHVDRAGAEPDLPGGGRKPGDEGDAGSDVLGLVGDVLADIRLRKPKLVRQKESFPVLLQGLPPILFKGMDRHREEPEFHDFCASQGAILAWRERASSNLTRQAPQNRKGCKIK